VALRKVFRWLLLVAIAWLSIRALVGLARYLRLRQL
jgi:hypothetical protein